MENEFNRINEVDKIYQEAQEYCKKDDIYTRINKYHQILEEIRKLKIEIERTNFISINDLEDLEDLDNEFKEESGYRCNDKYNLIVKVNGFFRYHDINADYDINANYKSDSIKLNALQIIKYNLEKKKRLKEIYQEYHSEEDIINNLQNIYLHQIKSLI